MVKAPLVEAKHLAVEQHLVVEVNRLVAEAQHLVAEAKHLVVKERLHHELQHPIIQRTPLVRQQKSGQSKRPIVRVIPLSLRRPRSSRLLKVPPASRILPLSQPISRQVRHLCQNV